MINKGLHVESIVYYFDGESYVFCTDGKPRIFVSGITEGSVADIDGRIKVNDQIIAVSFLCLCLWMNNKFILFYNIGVSVYVFCTC